MNNTHVSSLSLHDALPILMRPSKKFYRQEQAPIAGVDYRMGLTEDLYLVLGDFARDGSAHEVQVLGQDRKSTRLNSSHTVTSYDIFCLKRKISEQAVRYQT